MNFDQAFDALIGNEGGYSNNSADPGGETMWGVTARVARETGYAGAMRNFPRNAAKAIYRKQYWDAIRADQLPDQVRFDIFDAAVNSGVKQAVKWLQRVVGVSEDGIIGPATLGAASVVGESIGRRYSGVRLKFMTDLPTWPTFGRGWTRRIASNLTREVA